MGQSIESVEFSPNGMLFVLSGVRAVEVWSVDKAGIIKTIPCQSKPTALCWLDDDNVLIGLNDGNLVWSRLDNDEVSGFFHRFFFSQLLKNLGKQIVIILLFFVLATGIPNV